MPENTHRPGARLRGAGESGISAVVCRGGARMRVLFSEISCGGLRLSMSFLHLMVSQIGNRNIVSSRHRPNSMIRRAWRTRIYQFSGASAMKNVNGPFSKSLRRVQLRLLQMESLRPLDGGP